MTLATCSILHFVRPLRNAGLWRSLWFPSKLGAPPARVRGWWRFSQGQQQQEKTGTSRGTEGHYHGCPIVMPHEDGAKRHGRMTDARRSSRSGPNGDSFTSIPRPGNKQSTHVRITHGSTGRRLSRKSSFCKCVTRTSWIPET